MKGFYFTLTGKELARGLRTEFNAPRNLLLLKEALNVEARSYGLVSYEPIVVPFQQSDLMINNLEISFPFPQYIRGASVSFLLGRDLIFMVDETNWLFSQIATYDIDDPTKYKNPDPGNRWALIDMFDAWILVNGYSSIIHHNRFAMLGESDKVVVKNGKYINTGMYYRGRIILGGFDNSNFWGDWKTFFTNDANKINSGLVLDMPIAENFIMWSPIGMDLLWLYYPSIAQSGYISGAGYSTSDPMIYEIVMRNDFGFMPMPWNGSVLAIKELGDFVVVYGSNGITILKQFPEPAPTFGIVKNISIGIPDAGAVGGDDNVHMFLGGNGELFVLDSSLKMERLGYKEYFYDMLGTPISISYDPILRRFFIANQNRCFLFSNGLTEVSQRITSIEMYLGDVYAMGDDGYKDTRVLIVTDEFDFGTSDMKTIQDIRIDADGADLYSVAVDYKFNEKDGFIRSNFVQFNKQGWAYLNKAGTIFRLVLEADNFDEVGVPNSIRVGYKITDRRFTRGLDVSQITPRTG